MAQWFHVFACLNELGSDDISLPVTKLLPTVADIDGSVFSSDITNMASLYKRHNATLILKEANLSFVGNALQSFGKFVQEQRVKIGVFSFNYCPDEQLQFAGSFFPHVKKFEISPFGSLLDLTDRGRKNVLTLARSIKDGLLQIDHPHQMKKLVLCVIPFGDEGVSILSSEVGKVAELDMRDIGMTSVGAVKLGEHLEMETTQSMVRLDISCNEVGDIGACAITKSIHKM
uniref:Golgin subfamily A member 4-like n=1 Tax=Phallusia mammillata TaxID=59560 RepID=A0A6F9DEQ0_9ASCI|nr:golgin subfamily A member 4-like [Phallusia mammillata]